MMLVSSLVVPGSLPAFLTHHLLFGLSCQGYFCDIEQILGLFDESLGSPSKLVTHSPSKVVFITHSHVLLS